MSTRTSITLNALFLCFCAAALCLGGDEAAPFRPAPAPAWPSHMTIGKITFAAVRYESDADTRPLFAKVNPNERGVLPVLLLIENKEDQNLALDHMQVHFMAPGGVDLDPTRAADLPYLLGPKRPAGVERLPMPIPLPKKKNPLGHVEFETRGWGARTLLAGESAQGFFYFQTTWRRNAYLYITGIREGRTGKEVFYAEVPMDVPSDTAPAPAVR
jgi:hypothetical protein